MMEKDIDFNSIAPPLNLENIMSVEVYMDRLNDSNLVVVDVRSEGEFEEANLPTSINFSILDNDQRKDVGTIYKQESQQLAIDRAYFYAKRKEAQYLKKFEQYKKREILIYCWRGGGRSLYVTNLLLKNNYNVRQLKGGHKEFRKIVHNWLYEKELRAISLSGLTGVGKSELIEKMVKDKVDLPMVHIEECAGHASSVFGEIRFDLLGIGRPKNQQAFELNLFLEMWPHLKNDCKKPLLVERESRKIGKFIIPPSLMKAILKEEHIEIVASMQKRVERLEKDYFGEKDPDTCDEVKRCLGFLKRKLGDERLEKYNKMIDSGEHQLFLKEVLETVYDKYYAKTKIGPIDVINSDDLDRAIERLKELL